MVVWGSQSSLTFDLNGKLEVFTTPVSKIIFFLLSLSRSSYWEREIQLDEKEKFILFIAVFSLSQSAWPQETCNYWRLQWNKESQQNFTVMSFWISPFISNIDCEPDTSMY